MYVIPTESEGDPPVPLTALQIQTLAEEGVITFATPVKKIATGTTRRAGDIPGLKHIFTKNRTAPPNLFILYVLWAVACLLLGLERWGCI